MLKKILNYIKKIGLMILGFFGIFLDKKNIQNKKEETEEEGESGEEKTIKRINIKSENTANTFSNPKTKKAAPNKQLQIYEIDSLGMLIYKNNEFIIYKIYKGSLAEKHGFKENDIIKKVNSQKTKNMEIEDLKKELEKDEIKIEIEKNGQKNDIIIKSDKENMSLNQIQNSHPKETIVKDSKEKEPQLAKQAINMPKQKIITPQVINLAIKEPIFTKQFNQKNYKTALPKAIITAAIPPALIIQAIKQDKEKKDVKSSPQIKSNEPLIKPEIQNPKEPILTEETKEIQELKKEEPKEEKKLTEIDEAIILSEILEEDYKEKQAKALLKQKKEAIKDLTQPHQKDIKQGPFFILGFKSVRNLFRMYKLNNSLIASRNILNQSIPYIKVNYLVFLNKKFLRKATEKLILENIHHIESLKTDLIKTYGPLVKKDPTLITIMNNLDITYENLSINYNELTKNKNAKVKKKQIFHN